MRIDYSKLGPNVVIKDYELEAIMKANTPASMTWKKIAYNNPDTPDKMPIKLFESYFGEALGQKMWQRSDGAILWCRGNLIVRLELPIARENEAKLKAEKEEKARASVPQFQADNSASFFAELKLASMKFAVRRPIKSQ